MNTKYKPIILDCPKCEKKVRILFKMGGLICARCRTIIEDAYSPKWKEALEQVKKRNEGK